MKILKVITAVAIVVAILSSNSVYADDQHIPNVMVVLAHPDDETWMNGTLAKLASKEVNIHIVYITSGSEKWLITKWLFGPEDKNLERENEAKQALNTLTLKNRPIFLRYSHHNPEKQLKYVKNKMGELFRKHKIDIVITFGPFGVTGHLDHIVTALGTSMAVDLYDGVDVLLQIAVSEERAEIFNTISDANNARYKVAGAADNEAISVTVDVSEFVGERVTMVSKHESQFPQRLVKAFGEFAQKAPYEEFIVARSRSRAVDYQPLFR